MSKEYDAYLTEHIANVKRGMEWLYDNIPFIRSLIPNRFDLIGAGFRHDDSKYTKCEYDAYDDYFYGTKTEEVKMAFNFAWLKHIHENPHHWQHWVLIHDDEPMEALEMPEVYVIEMIADWWSFSWKKGKLFEIFDWYDKHKDGMILHEKTRELVEKILDLMKEELSYKQEDKTDDD